jgi:hypothetical protein
MFRTNGLKLLLQSILVFDIGQQYAVQLITDPNQLAGYNCDDTKGMSSSYISDGSSHITGVVLSVTPEQTKGHVVGI